MYLARYVLIGDNVNNKQIFQSGIGWSLWMAPLNDSYKIVFIKFELRM